MKTAKPKPQHQRLDGKKKLVAFTQDMERGIKRFCLEKGIENESELIRQAVLKYITPEDYNDASLKLQGLRDISGKTAELRDMVDVVFRYLRLMHVSILAYNPEIDASLADAALRSAQARHERFFAAFQESLKNDPPFFERLLHTYFGEGKT